MMCHFLRSAPKYTDKSEKKAQFSFAVFIFICNHAIFTRFMLHREVKFLIFLSAYAILPTASSKTKMSEMAQTRYNEDFELPSLFAWSVCVK